jgi:alkylation response protein AidB-like acyl-CoA dehydrogenase
MLLIDLKSSGITVRPIQTIRGDSEFAEEFFVDVRVPKENMLGSLNGGWQVANKLLGSERFTTGHPRNAAVLLNKARRVAEYSGAARDPAFLHRLALLEIDLLAFSAFIATPRVCMPTARHPPRWRQSSRLPAANSVSRPPNCWSMRRGRSAEAPPIS